MIYLQHSILVILFGVATVETSSVKKEAEFDGKLNYGSESTSLVARNLLNKDEIIRMDNDIQIIIIRGYKAFKCKKLRYWEYRLGKNIKLEAIENYKPKNTTTLSKIEYAKEKQELPTFEEFLKGRRK